MFCGNGGSAADAQHLAAELLVRLRQNKQCITRYISCTGALNNHSL